MVGGRLHDDTNAPDALDKADLREAYERGRRDERAARKRHPVLMTFTVIAAAVGVLLLVLAAVNGSFARGGGVVDQGLNLAANRAEPAVREAAGEARQSLPGVGEPAAKTPETAG